MTNIFNNEHFKVLSGTHGESRILSHAKNEGKRLFDQVHIAKVYYMINASEDQHTLNLFEMILDQANM
jgi:hypothetical protein